MGLINSDLPLKDSYSEIDEIKIGKELNYYLHFFNNTYDFNCIANLEGYFEIINPRFEEVLGYSKKELLASRFLDFIHADDIKGTLNEIEKLKTGIKTINFTNRYRKKDGSYLWLEWNSTSDVASGKIFAIARDITSRKLAEEALSIKITELEINEKKFQDIFESLPGLFLVLSTDFKIIAVSNSYLKAVFMKREDIIGKLIFDIFPEKINSSLPNSEDNLRASFNRVIQTKLSDKMMMQQYDIKLKRFEQGNDYFEILFWQPYNSPVLDDNGNLLYIIHHVENITKRKKLE